MRPASIGEEEVVRGSDLDATYEMTDATGALIDLTAISIEIHFRAQQGDGDVLEKLKADMDVTALGRMTVHISREETAEWDEGIVDFEIVIDAAATRVYQAEGAFRVRNPRTGEIVP